MGLIYSPPPKIGWWKDMNVKEFMLELERLRNTHFRKEDMSLTHDVFFGSRCIGQAGQLEKFGNGFLGFFMLSSAGAATLGPETIAFLGYKTDMPLYMILQRSYALKEH